MSFKKKSINASFVTPRMEKNKKRGLGFSDFAFSFKQKNCFFAFCFAVKPIYLWIYFQNFCNFVCMLMNAKERSLNFLFPSFTSLTSLVKKKL